MVRRWLGLMTLLLFLSPTAPAVADFTAPSAVTPRGVHTEAMDQATDLNGDTAYAFAASGDFNVRIRRAGGRLSSVLAISPIVHPWTTLRVSVDDDGDGVVIWDQLPEGGFQGYLYARRFSREGRLGPVVQVTPDDHWLSDAQVASRPKGGAVITWTRITDSGYTPYVRTLGSSNRLGPVLRVGPGPDVAAPLIAMERTGRATLVWTNTDLLVRRLNTDGTLSPMRLVRRQAYDNEGLGPDEIAIDRRGILSIACERRTRNTATWPDDNSYDRACLLRLSPKLRIMERVQNVSQAGLDIDSGRVDLGVAPNGAAVIGWQKNFVDGAWVRRIRPNGSLGSRVKVSNGGTGDIALSGDGDGVVASRGVAADGKYRVIRVTRIVDGAVGKTRTVGFSDDDTRYLRVGLTSRGRILVSWNEELYPARILVVTGR